MPSYAPLIHYITTIIIVISTVGTSCMNYPAPWARLCLILASILALSYSVANGSWLIISIHASCILVNIVGLVYFIIKKRSEK